MKEESLEKKASCVSNYLASDVQNVIDQREDYKYDDSKENNSILSKEKDENQKEELKQDPSIFCDNIQEVSNI